MISKTKAHHTKARREGERERERKTETMLCSRRIQRVRESLAHSGLEEKPRDAKLPVLTRVFIGCSEDEGSGRAQGRDLADWFITKQKPLQKKRLLRKGLRGF